MRHVNGARQPGGHSPVHGSPTRSQNGHHMAAGAPPPPDPVTQHFVAKARDCLAGDAFKDALEHLRSAEKRARTVHGDADPATWEVMNLMGDAHAGVKGYARAGACYLEALAGYTGIENPSRRDANEAAMKHAQLQLRRQRHAGGSSSAAGSPRLLSPASPVATGSPRGGAPPHSAWYTDEIVGVYNSLAYCCFSSAMAAAPLAPTRYAWLRLAAGWYDNAAADAADPPDILDAQQSKGRVLMRMGRWNEAARAFERAAATAAGGGCGGREVVDSLKQQMEVAQKKWQKYRTQCALAAITALVRRVRRRRAGRSHEEAAPDSHRPPTAAEEERAATLIGLAEGCGERAMREAQHSKGWLGSLRQADTLLGQVLAAPCTPNQRAHALIVRAQILSQLGRHDDSLACIDRAAAVADVDERAVDEAVAMRASIAATAERMAQCRAHGAILAAWRRRQRRRALREGEAAARAGIVATAAAEWSAISEAGAAAIGGLRRRDAWVQSAQACARIAGEDPDEYSKARLGLLERAEGLWLRVVADTPDTAATIGPLCRVGILRGQRGRHAAGVAVLEEALRVRREHAHPPEPSAELIEAHLATARASVVTLTEHRAAGCIGAAWWYSRKWRAGVHTSPRPPPPGTAVGAGPAGAAATGDADGAARNSPCVVDMWANMARAYTRLAADEPEFSMARASLLEKAECMWRRVVEHTHAPAEKVPPLSHMGVVVGQRGRYAESVAVLEEALALRVAHADEPPKMPTRDMVEAYIATARESRTALENHVAAGTIAAAWRRCVAARRRIAAEHAAAQHAERGGFEDHEAQRRAGIVHEEGAALSAMLSQAATHRAEAAGAAARQAVVEAESASRGVVRDDEASTCESILHDAANAYASATAAAARRGAREAEATARTACGEQQAAGWRNLVTAEARERALVSDATAEARARAGIADEAAAEWHAVRREAGVRKIEAEAAAALREVRECEARERRSIADEEGGERAAAGDAAARRTELEAEAAAAMDAIMADEDRARTVTLEEAWKQHAVAEGRVATRKHVEAEVAGRDIIAAEETDVRGELTSEADAHRSGLEAASARRGVLADEASARMAVEGDEALARHTALVRHTAVDAEAGARAAIADDAAAAWTALLDDERACNAAAVSRAAVRLEGEAAQAEAGARNAVREAEADAWRGLLDDAAAQHAGAGAAVARRRHVEAEAAGRGAAADDEAHARTQLVGNAMLQRGAIRDAAARGATADAEAATRAALEDSQVREWCGMVDIAAAALARVRARRTSDARAALLEHETAAREPIATTEQSERTALTLEETHERQAATASTHARLAAESSAEERAEVAAREAVQDQESCARRAIASDEAATRASTADEAAAARDAATARQEAETATAAATAKAMRSEVAAAPWNVAGGDQTSHDTAAGGASVPQEHDPSFVGALAAAAGSSGAEEAPSTAHDTSAEEGCARERSGLKPGPPPKRSGDAVGGDGGTKRTAAGVDNSTTRGNGCEGAAVSTATTEGTRGRSDSASAGNDTRAVGGPVENRPRGHSGGHSRSGSASAAEGEPGGGTPAAAAAAGGDRVCAEEEVGANGGGDRRDHTAAGEETPAGPVGDRPRVHSGGHRRSGSASTRPDAEPGRGTPAPAAASGGPTSASRHTAAAGDGTARDRPQADSDGHDRPGSAAALPRRSTQERGGQSEEAPGGAGAAPEDGRGNRRTAPAAGEDGSGTCGGGQEQAGTCTGRGASPAAAAVGGDIACAQKEVGAGGGDGSSGSNGGAGDLLAAGGDKVALDHDSSPPLCAGAGIRAQRDLQPVRRPARMAGPLRAATTTTGAGSPRGAPPAKLAPVRASRGAAGQNRHGGRGGAPSVQCASPPRAAGAGAGVAPTSDRVVRSVDSLQDPHARATNASASASASSPQRVGFGSPRATTPPKAAVGSDSDTGPTCGSPTWARRRKLRASVPATSRRHEAGAGGAKATAAVSPRNVQQRRGMRPVVCDASGSSSDVDADGSLPQSLTSAGSPRSSPRRLRHSRASSPMVVWDPVGRTVFYTKNSTSDAGGGGGDGDRKHCRSASARPRSVAEDDSAIPDASLAPLTPPPRRRTDPVASSPHEVNQSKQQQQHLLPPDPQQQAHLPSLKVIQATHTRNSRRFAVEERAAVLDALLGTDLSTLTPSMQRKRQLLSQL